MSLRALPPSVPARRWSAPGARGWAWVEVDDAFDADLRRWLATGEVAEGEELKRRKSSVFRLGQIVVKFFRPDRSPFRALRPSPAVRAARRHFQLLPLRSSRPLVAVTAEIPGGQVDVLVGEFLEGEPLDRVWEHDAAARAALPEILAQLRRRRIVHGDLHPGNLLWTGTEWALLDLESVRGGLHRLFAPPRASRARWARLLLLLGDEAGLRAAHARYFELLRPGRDPGPAWERVVEEAEHQLARRKAGARNRWRGRDPASTR
jgi:hypothetical protein